MRHATLAFILMASPALAQSRSAADMGFFDKEAIFGKHTFMLEAELDGNPATREWAGWDTAGDHAGWWRVAALDPATGRVCVSPYTPALSHDGLVPYEPGEVFYVNLLVVQGRSQIQVQSLRWYRTVPLQMPVCQ